MYLGMLMFAAVVTPTTDPVTMVMMGGPMLILSFGLILFGVYDNGSTPAFLLALPEIIWEASLGIYCAWKGFRPSPIPEHTVATT